MFLAPLGTLALSELPTRYRLATTPPYALLLADPDARPLFLVLAHPYDGAAETAVYLASESYRTRPDDADLSSQPFVSRLSKSFQINASLFSGATPSGGASNAGSEIEALNEGHDLDDWADYAWDGRSVQVYAGLRGFSFGEFGLIARWTADGVEVSRASGTIHLRDRSAIFEKQLQQGLYAGTGGREGGPDQAGVVKPLGYGYVRNAQPVPVDLALGIYQLHDGPISWVHALRDKGVPPGAGWTGDYASYAALAAATMPAFGWASCVAEGFVRINFMPAGQITCDFSGDVTGGYVDNCAAIARRIVTTRLGADNLADPDDLDAASFLATETANLATIGLYLTATATVRSVLDAIMGSIYGYWYLDRSGSLALGILDRQSGADISITDKIIGPDGVSIISTDPPPWRVNVGYGKVWLVQRDADLAAGSISDADRALYHDEYRYSTLESAEVKAAHKLSDTLDWPTLLVNKADADGVAGRIMSYSTSPWRRFRVPVNRANLSLWLDKSILLQSDDLGLSSGVVGKIVSVSEDYGANTSEYEVLV